MWTYWEHGMSWQWGTNVTQRFVHVKNLLITNHVATNAVHRARKDPRRNIGSVYEQQAEGLAGIPSKKANCSAAALCIIRFHCCEVTATRSPRVKTVPWSSTT